LLSASLDSLHEQAGADEAEQAASASESTEMDDLISKAAVAVEGHAAAAELSRVRMARLSTDAEKSLRSAIIGETPPQPGMPARGVTSGTRLDVQR